ncbi:MAG: PKD domain-containing protein [Verrucomicrobiota bacterium]
MRIRSTKNPTRETNVSESLPALPDESTPNQPVNMKKMLVRSICGLLCAAAASALAASNQLVGWNNLGMHCMDSDYSVFSILPPYNTIEAQLIVGGKLVTNGSGYTVTYQAVADPEGSLNSTSRGKGNFHDFVQPIYGPAAQPEFGLTPWPMPGTNNTPQGMLFEATNQPAPGVATRVNWFRAEGIPITPYDDAGRKNPYPMMRLIAKNGATPIATNDIVLPVSDEMDCRACHASGTQDAARPAAGWVWAANQERDFRLNILKLHDERNFSQHHGLYVEALAARGYNPLGLYRGNVADGKPVLCAMCHSSEALGLPSYGTIPPLTASIHSKHATVMDPVLKLALNDSAHREACYRCHPGSATKCLRGAMGGAIANDGSMSMQCQSCHGSMSQVGSSSRVGWFMEPNCQGCHSGSATANSGQIRYTSVFTDTNGTVRVPANTIFATQPNTPAPGISLYRFSAGHGGLQCSACHGSTHAEFPATHKNDNVRNEKIQGHAGVMVECTSCHTSMSVNSSTARGGPHGMHPIGSAWISGHHDYIGSLANCQACHGSDSRGTVLSRMQADRVLVARFDSGSVTNMMFRGALVGCYTCHNGPDNESPNLAAAPGATSFTTNTVSGQPVAATLPISGTGATVRIISQPGHGSVGLNGTVATYFPDAGYTGTDSFTFASWNGAKNSLLATGIVTVAQGPFGLITATHVPPTWPAHWPAPFNAVPAASNVVGTLTFEWNFGDGSAHGINQSATHAYAAPGSYNWTLISTMMAAAGSASTTNTGVIGITAPTAVAMVPATTGNKLSLRWPLTAGDSLLEESTSLSPAMWRAVTNGLPLSVGGEAVLELPTGGAQKYYRLRQL